MTPVVGVGLENGVKKWDPACAICSVFVDESGFRLSKIGHSWLPTPLVTKASVRATGAHRFNLCSR